MCMQLVYYYLAGDEQIIEYCITIYKERNNIYTIIYEQDSLEISQALSLY